MKFGKQALDITYHICRQWKLLNENISSVRCVAQVKATDKKRKYTFSIYILPKRLAPGFDLG
jgi:hypothetical protein